MSKRIFDIVLAQKLEREHQMERPYVVRDVPVEWLKKPGDLARVIMGPRRAGKSTLAVHLLQESGGGGYLNFDDERLSGFADTDSLLAAIDGVYGRPEMLLFDEIQNLPRWELFVNRLQREGRKLLLTGSNANLLAGELATHLTGRHQQLVLLPFSFKESLRGEPLPGAELAARLIAYLSDGGYPEPLLRGANRAEYLRDLVRATLHKDIVQRYRLRSAAGLEQVAHGLMFNVGKEFSTRTLAEIGGVASPMTAEKHVRMLSEAFLIFTLSRFSFKLRERATGNRKVYAIDPALAVYLGTRPGSDLGRLAENVVALALWRHHLTGAIELSFWKSRDHNEVDFVIRRNGQIAALVQVCWSLDDPRTRSREFRALAKASVELRCENLICLCPGREEQADFNWQGRRFEIHVHALENWLLNPDNLNFD